MAHSSRPSNHRQQAATWMSTVYGISLGLGNSWPNPSQPDIDQGSGNLIHKWVLSPLLLFDRPIWALQSTLQILTALCPKTLLSILHVFFFPNLLSPKQPCSSRPTTHTAETIETMWGPCFEETQLPCMEFTSRNLIICNSCLHVVGYDKEQGNCNE